MLCLAQGLATIKDCLVPECIIKKLGLAAELCLAQELVLRAKSAKSTFKI